MRESSHLIEGYTSTAKRCATMTGAVLSEEGVRADAAMAVAYVEAQNFNREYRNYRTAKAAAGKRAVAYGRWLTIHKARLVAAIAKKRVLVQQRAKINDLTDVA